MRITDTLTKRQVKKFDQKALEMFQGVLDANLQDDYIGKVIGIIKKQMLKTGSCVLMPNRNIPPTCRLGMTNVQTARAEADIYFPLYHCVFSKKENPGDPMLFCIIGNSSAAILYEWEHFFDNWRQSNISLVNTSSEDMRRLDSNLRLQLQQMRQRKQIADKEESRNAKRKLKN